jgi:hypothetical protein
MIGVRGAPVAEVGRVSIEEGGVASDLAVERAEAYVGLDGADAVLGAEEVGGFGEWEVDLAAAVDEDALEGGAFEATCCPREAAV